MKKLFFYTIVLFSAVFMMSSCQDSSGGELFVIVVETENESDAYKIEYVKHYVNGKERNTAQIDTLGEVFYTHIDISHTSTGQKIEYLPITIKRVNGDGKIRFSIVEFNRFKSLTFKDLPEALKTNGNILSDEDLDWVHENAAYSVILQPAEQEREVLINTRL